jgi:hypothetical protein
MSAVTTLPVAVRAYTEGARKKRARVRDAARIGLDAPSARTLIFDTETTTNAAQALRVGVYQVREDAALLEEGVFFDPEGLSPEERETLRAYAAANGLQLRTLWEFVHRVFYRQAYDRRATVIGFNLPFDLSRLAIRHAEARGSMRGGFSFALSPFPDRPKVRVKHLSRSAALIDFAAGVGQDTPRGMRKRGLKVEPHRGFFVDVKTIWSALRSTGGGLSEVSRQLHKEGRVSAVKAETDDHGGPLTPEYLAYARQDVQSTWECFAALRDEYAGHGLATPLHRILSEASVGKAYLKAMGVKPLLELHPDFPRALFGPVMCAYYGGRAEVNLRRTPKRVLYVDFKSMYPTVNALMGLWRFVIADRLTWRDATAEARDFLDKVTAESFGEPPLWPWLTAIVRVRPDGDLLPARAKYDGRTHTIGLNRLSGEQPLWWTLADAVAAKLLSGKAPVIEEAIFFEPGPPQEGLRSIKLFGRDDFAIDPYGDDVFKHLIDLRDEAKARGDKRQKAIKIIANATSYGMFVEVNRDDAPKPEPISVWGPDGERLDTQSTAVEQPGRFFNPVLATLITGAARLMLALAQRRVLSEGLDWVFCDTDSLAIAMPDGMSEAAFVALSRRVVAWFEGLNPYRKPGSILQVEDVNYAPGTKELRPLYAFAISAKRYALYNLDEGGRPILRKASAHGLGHLRAPYEEADAPAAIPPPSVSLSEIGVERWQHDLWFKIVEAALSKKPHKVALDYHPALARPAVSRYGATSPALLRWFTRWNAGRPSREQVKPFNFLLAFMGRNGLWARVEAEPLDATLGPGRPRKARPDLHPVAPFERDPAKAALGAFDRETGEPVSPNDLMTCAEALAHYHLSPENKFANADYSDSGRTERRHVIATGIVPIGKESNRLESEMPANVLGEDVARYGSSTAA